MLPLKARLLHALLAVVLWSGLALGAWMKPSEKGHGTHRQLGLPPCSWMLMYDMPCPSCGMTTAVSNAAHGRLVDLFSNPAGGGHHRSLDLRGGGRGHRRGTVWKSAGSLFVQCPHAKCGMDGRWGACSGLGL